MELLENIAQQLGPGSIEALSKQLGSSPKATSSAVEAALPVLLGALAKNSASSEGAQALDQALEKDHDGSILGQLAPFLGQGDTGPGKAILGHLLGGRESAVSAGVGRAVGLSPEQTGNLFSMLAPVVMGAVGQQKRSQGLSAEALGKMLSSQSSQTGQAHPALNMLTSLLDKDGDGSVLDDLAQNGVGLLGKFFGKN